jgi:hypothetical protein
MKAEKPNDILVNDLGAAWTTPDENGTIRVMLNGVFQFEIHESHDDKGEIQYTSSVFRTTQDELKDALELGITNGARAAFKKRYAELFPAEPKVRKPRRSIKLEFEISQKQTKLVRAAMKQGLEPDFAAAGLPVPDWWESEDDDETPDVA